MSLTTTFKLFFSFLKLNETLYDTLLNVGFLFLNQGNLQPETFILTLSLVMGRNRSGKLCVRFGNDVMKKFQNSQVSILDL